MNQRLSNWKKKNLSFAGLLTFSKSVLEVLSSNTMQTTFLPKYICEEIDIRCREFSIFYAHWLDEGPIYEEIPYVHIYDTQLHVKDVLVNGH